MSRADVNRFVCKLTLVKYGLLKECYDIDGINLSSKSSTATASKDDSDDDEVDPDAKDIIARRNAFVKNALKQAGFSKKRNDWADTKIESVANERRAIVKEFLYSITKSKKCNNCNGISPAYRKDRYIKIFKKPLSEKDRNAMVQGGFKAQDPLLLMKKKREALAKKKGLAEDEAVADLEDSPAESEGEGDDISMLDIEQEVAGGNALEHDTTDAPSSKADKDERQIYLNAGQVHAHLVQLFEKDAEVLSMVYTPRSRGRRGAPLSAEMFFIKDLIVPPNRFRPEARTGSDEIAEAQENSLYKNIINVCEQMAQIHKELNGQVQNDPARRPRNYADFQDAWIRLQDGVNSLLDRDRNPVQGGAGKRNEDGIKQRLEKKEGLFRKNMMGKRVNFAARTVISPDPNIETNEIGVPPVFALKLTYPEPVNDHNFNDLRQAVINGPYIWPGAVAIENENGQVINLQIKNFEERTALANQLQAPSSTNVSGVKSKKVHRHLNNGDIVIMNRQPTLHKPSMMCHRARVLPGEKTLRMHYANCNTYNADFDGDEMNLHFPQNELARSEAISIADNDHQYLSGTAGKPLRGLIQDHISMGVWLTNRDTFYGREDYHQLLYAGLRPEDNHTTSGRVETVPPAIRKPRPLWTGKQVITTIMKNLTPEDFPGLTMTSKSTTASKNWGTDSEEQVVIFKDGEMLCGILDKAQIGPAGGGVVNAIYEAYGHTIAGKLMSVLGRLLTKMLHMRAFSCGVEDLIFTPEGEAMRREALGKSEAAGLRVAAKYVSLTSENPSTNDPELYRRLEAVLREEGKQAGLDTVMNQNTAAVSGDVTTACLPVALVKPFPKNQMQAMTGSGAKGSGVNANQISCNLGQQVLEGRRVPVMVSGKTLPCFKPFETSVRAGGYIVDRFLTGVRPQEYYFHAMAGREGLIDTAVKTSRSGYLQRCLIKGMEGLKSEYDTTVRDADGSIIQFIYGEDGLDVGKAKYLSNFKFIAENHMSMFHNLGIQSEFGRIMSAEASEYNKNAEKKFRKTGDLGASDPALSIYSPARFAGSTSEKLMRDAKKYIDENPDRLIKDKKRNIGGVEGLTKKGFQAIIDVRYLKSIVEPGEAVGVVAGQSVGEPSTQMTLNTFHLAGHAAKNVTLGIPRLREIVMTASSTIATPTMTLHINPEIEKEQSEQFAKGISRLSLAEVLDKVTVTEKIGRGVAYEQAKSYTVRLQLFPSAEYTEEYAITVEDVARTIETKFLPRLQAVVRKELKKKGDQKTLKKSDAMPAIGESAGTIEQESGRPEADHEGGEDDSDDEGDDDATRDKAKNNKSQSGYDAPDDDEEAIAARARRETTPEEHEDEGFGGSADTSDDSDSDVEDAAARIRKVAYNSKEREERIKGNKYTSDVSAFKFDDKTGASCTFTIEYAAETAKLLMLNLVENCLRGALIQSIPGLAGCILTTDKFKDPSNGKVAEVDVIMTEGENLMAMRLHQGVLNPNRFFTNDIAAMLRLYGVEACRASIVREVSGVFGGHGIDVDQRHLNLIADYMTRSGGYQAFSRQGIKGNTSPFMKMSFETTVGFLRDAVMEEDFDDLNGPSGRIVVGKIGRIGTGGFDVMMPVSQVSSDLSSDDAEMNGNVMAVDQSSESEEESEDE
jgi:DNA-directed RNA polymerase beta' subunit